VEDYEKTFFRNIGVVSEAEQKKLKQSKVAVIGLGGIGGIAFEMLARSGVGNFVLVDKDEFEISNLNRQVLSSRLVLGEKKAVVAAQCLSAINAEAKATVYVGELGERNVSKVISGADAVIDGLDSAISRVILSRESRRKKIPYVFGAAGGSAGMSSVFISESYEKCLSLPSEGKNIPTARKLLANYPRGRPIIGVAASQVGIFQATQALCVLLKKPFVRAPDFMFFDAFGKEKSRLRAL